MGNSFIAIGSPPRKGPLRSTHDRIFYFEFRSCIGCVTSALFPGGAPCCGSRWLVPFRPGCLCVVVWLGPGCFLLVPLLVLLGHLRSRRRFSACSSSSRLERNKYSTEGIALTPIGSLHFLSLGIFGAHTLYSRAVEGQIQ